MPVVVIGDIVHSRELPDRDLAQQLLEAAFAQANGDVPGAIEPIAPAVGDEFQGVFATLDDALVTLLLVQLALPPEVSCRFGVGWGNIGKVKSSSDRIQDGPGWTAARQAIGLVEDGSRHRRGRVRGARSWLVVAEEEGPAAIERGRVVNAYLLARDQLVDGMMARERRLAYGTWLGTPQRELAAREGISQPAVSQLLNDSGARAILGGIDVLSGKPGSPWS